MKRMLEWVARRLPSRTIPGPDGEPYLTKYLLVSRGDRDGWRLHLHRFWRSDLDRAVHDHPWAWACSLILAGGYREERVFYEGYRRVTIRKSFWPWSCNVIRHSDFHRVELLHGECWTLFLSGPVVSSWGFLDALGRVVPWREFLAERGQQPPEGEYWKESRS